MARKRTRAKGKVTPLGRALRLLREALDLTQDEVARILGRAPGLISDYECGQRDLKKERLVRIVEALGLPLSAIERALAFAEAVRSGVGAKERWSEAEARKADLLEWGAQRSRDFLDAFHTRLLRAAITEVDRRRAEAAWAALQVWDEAAWPGLVEQHEEYRGWALAERICAESRRAAARNAKEALALANLAVRIARRLPEGEAGGFFARRLEGFAQAHAANALRVGGSLPKADEAYARAKQLWDEGAAGDPEPRRLDEAVVLGMESSLRKDQRRLPEALAALDRSLDLARGGLVADLWISRANVLELQGKYEAALATLRRVEPLLEGNAQPRSRWLQRCALMANLCHLSCPQEAEELLPEVQTLALERGDELDQLRLQWLRGRIAAGQGRLADAAAFFAGVRDAFERLGIPYDTALVAVELAAVYLEEGRSPEVKALARQLAAAFSTQKVPAEVERALRLFVAAVQQETATAELARRLAAYLYRARGDASLSFKREG
jgi:transcriptional regulator with XRE-family HTH domain